MNNVIIEQEYINPLILQNKIVKLDQQFCQEFDEYISSSYTWQKYPPYKIEWSNIKVMELDLRGTQPQEIYSFLQNSNLKGFEYLAIVFAAFEPGVYGKTENIVENLFAFIAHCAGPFFIIAMELDKYNLPILHHELLVEVDGIKRILRSPSDT